MADPSAFILPPELQRIIFELATPMGEHGAALNFLLVAKYVHDWVKPRLYAVFRQIDWHKASYPKFDSNPYLKIEDVGQFAKHLLIGGSRTPFSIPYFISSCPNIQNLAIWRTTLELGKLLPVLLRLPLRRLSADFATLSDADLRGPWLDNLTHLDVIGYARWSDLPIGPSLTHLGINEPVAIPVIRDILLRGINLRIILIFQDEGASWGHSRTIDEHVALEDARVVLMDRDATCDMAEEWENGAHGKMDCWVFSELISSARQRKYLHDNSQRWVLRSFRWEEELITEGKEWYFRVALDYL